MGIEYLLYILSILAILLCIYAQFKVQSTFNKYSSVYTKDGTAASVARRILDAEGLSDVAIERVYGSLTDHYDPRARVLRLSDSVYDSSSMAAVGVAAHECGHAIQHARGYFPLKLRTAIAPAVGFASRFNWLVIMLGILFMAFDASLGYYTVLVGIGLFVITTLFQLITLPCELNASGRALAALRQMNCYSTDELSASKRVLSAAAFTYVAALLVSLLQLLRLLVRFVGRGRRR
jgi:Zn-dependent membrane protease YugP